MFRRGLGASAPESQQVRALQLPIMKTSMPVILLLVPGLLLTGCSPQAVAERVSTTQVCAESASILRDMREIVLLAATNPAGVATYAEKLGQLLDEFDSLDPLEPGLKVAHTKVSASVNALLAAVADPSVSALADVPTHIADAQIGLVEFVDACAS